MYNQIEVDCEVCGCKVMKNKWERHVKTEKHRKGVDGGGDDGKVGGDMVGWAELSSKDIDYYIKNICL